MQIPTLLATTALLGGSVLCHAAVAPAYSDPVPFNRPGYAATQLWDINDSGVIVGSSDGVGFIYAGGVFSSVVHPDATGGTLVTGIAGDGTLVGIYRTGAPGALVSNSFIHSGGVFTTFDAPGANTEIRHISENGRYLTGTAISPLGPGFAYDRQTAELTVFAVPGAQINSTQGANDAGRVTGSYTAVPAGGPPIRASYVHDLSSGLTVETLDVNGLERPRFRDINNDGVITGTAGAQNLAFVGTPGAWHVFDPMPGYDSVWGYGLNNAGVLVGWAFNAGTGLSTGWVSSPVPEPGTWLLMALGLGVLARRARRGA